MSEVRVPEVHVEPLTEGEAQLLLPLIGVEPLTEGQPNQRVTLVTVDPLTEGTPNQRLNLVTIDPLTEGVSVIRVDYIAVEALAQVVEEDEMATEVFPGFGGPGWVPNDPFNSALPGLTFSVHKRPMFNTRKYEAASGNEVRNPLMQYPKYEFELSYEYLEDRSGALSSLKTLMGFYNSRLGSAYDFLFKDPDFYTVTSQQFAVADGVTTIFPLMMSVGSEWTERIGQLDTDNVWSINLSIEEAGVIPVTPGPYTITVANVADFLEDLGVTKGGVPLTRVAGAPAASQYSETAGVYTFNATDQGDAVVISYRYLSNPAGYEFLAPNKIVFDVAPADNAILSWSGQYYYVCRFKEDIADFEKFMDKLWSLQQLEFVSQPK